MSDFFSSLGSFAGQGALNYLTASINDSFRHKALEESTSASKDLMSYQADLQNKYQRQQNLEASSIMRRSKEAAGYNVNSEAGGYSPALGVSPSASQTSSPAQMSPIDVASLLSLKSQVDLNKASARDLNATAKGKEIENTRQEDFDAYLNGDHNLYNEETGEIIVLPRYKNKGEYDAVNAYKDMAVLNQKRYSEISTYKALQAKADLEKKVSEGQIKDHSVAEALVKMPEGQYIFLVNQSKELASRDELNVKNKEFLELKTKIAKDTSFSGLLEQLHDPSLSTMDKAEKILIFLVSLAASKL